MDAFSSKALFSKNYLIAYLVLFFIAFSKTLFSMSIQSMEVSLSLLLGFFNFKLNQLNKCRLYKKHKFTMKKIIYLQIVLGREERSVNW